MSYQKQQTSQFIENEEPQYQAQPQPYILREDEKIPLFLIKLWNIVEDPSYYDVIRWDESGYSFHITDPYSFCRNVLPQYFKHNNLNSLIRQLNMYGFRKMTPIDRSSLARAESDQDHLEFSHPYFVRDHPELLMNIKRKVPTKQASDSGTVTLPSKDLTSVLEELKQLRDRQKNMEYKMNELVKENELIWQEMDHVRGAHLKQQQIVNKLVQFLVLLVQPSKQQRLGKRQLLAIDEFAAKRFRDDESSNGGNSNRRSFNTSVQSTAGNGSLNANEILDSLINELASGGMINFPAVNLRATTNSVATSNGPIIADVTDELDQLQCASNSEEAGSPKVGFLEKPKLYTPPAPSYSRNRGYSQTAQLMPNGQKNKNGGRTITLASIPSGNTVSIADPPTPGTRVPPRYNNRNESGYNIRYSLPQHRYSRLTSSYPAQVDSTITSQDGLPRKLFPSNNRVPTFVGQQPRRLTQNSNMLRQQQPSLPQLYYDTIQQSPQPPSELCCDGGSGELIANLPMSNEFIQQQQPQNLQICQKPQQQELQGLPIGMNDAECGGLMVKGDDPSLVITAPGLAPQTPAGGSATFEDSPHNFGNYLSSVDESINQCRDNIANHWENVDLDQLLDTQDWNELLNEELANEQHNENVDNQLMGLSSLANVPLATPQKP